MRLNKQIFIGFLLIVFVDCTKSGVPDPPAANTFSNPLLSNGFDPWVIKKDSFYYYTSTQGNRISIWKTKAMSQLSFSAPHTIWQKPSSGPNSEHVWAPELHYLDDKWYMYYTAGATPDRNTQRIFVLENISADPTQGTWIDKGEIRDTTADFWAIDATVFEQNGNRYMLWSGHASASDFTQRIYIARLLNPWTLATHRTLISSPTYSWEMFGATGDLPSVNEGPEILKNANGKVFLIFSASGCWTDEYELGMATLEDGGNPLNASDWIKSPEPVFTKKPENNAYGPGHCSFFKSTDGSEDWLIYHANSFPDQGCGDARNPRMQNFTWNTDGTPNFGEPVKINTPITKPAGE